MAAHFKQCAVVFMLGLLVLLAQAGSLDGAPGPRSPQGPGGSSAEQAPTAAQIQAKIEALKAAFDAGILTREEYEKKKADLEVQLKAASRPQLDEAAQKKLKALDAAREAGLLTDEEYQRKKAEILGEKAVPGSGAGAPSGAAQYVDSRAGFQFEHSSSWNVRPFPNGQGVLLEQGRATLSILVRERGAGAERILDSVAGEIKKQWGDYREVARRSGKAAGGAAPQLEFQGTDPRKASARGLLTAFVAGSSGYAVLVTAPQDEFAAARAACDDILRSFKSDAALVSQKKGKTYQHAIGFSFWYPDGWSVQVHPDFLQIVPPNPGTSPDGPTELYVIFGESVEQEGIQRPDDPGVIQYLDEQVRSVIPAMRRTGSPGAVSMARGSGAMMDWEGKNQRGQTVRARAYACIINGFGVALAGVALEDQLKARDGDLRQMFATFGFGEGKREAELVGSWALVSTYSIWNTSPFETDSSRARAVSETQSGLVLGADGKWTRTDVSEFIAMGAGMVISSGPEKKVSRGRWYAADGVLHLISEGDSWEDYNYQLATTAEGKQLKLVSGKTGEIWKPSR